MKKILMLTDFSEASHNALQFARSFFGDTVADFHLLCVHPAKPDDKLARVTSADQIHDVVTGLRREATTDWHTFRSSDRPGHPLEVVGQSVEAEVYDFVIIGPQKADTNELFGNSAIALVRRLKANVLVVPTDARPRPVRRVVLAADFANLKNCKLLSPVKELVTLKGATLTLLTIDTPDKKAIHVDQEAHIRQFLKPIKPIIARLQAPTAKQGIDAYLAGHPVDLLVTIPQSKTDALTESRIARSRYTPPVPLLTLYDDGSNDLPQLIEDLSNVDYAL